MNPFLTLSVLISTFSFQFKLDAQDMVWSKVNASSFMLSESPHGGHTDCHNGIILGSIPSLFYEHIVTDSLEISSDLKWVKVTFRFFVKLGQVDSNDLRNYSLEKDSSSRFSDLKELWKYKFKRSGDSLFCFNFIRSNIENEYKLDSIQLYSAKRIRVNDCNDNFPFGDCPYNFFRSINMREFKIVNGKYVSVKFPDCYKINGMQVVKNDAKPITLILPLNHSFIGSGRSYLELHDYLKTWNSKMKLFLKPFTGKYNSNASIWTFSHDANKTTTNAFMSFYNGGFDTLFIHECFTSSGNAVIQRFPKFIAPATWANIELVVDHKNKMNLPKESTIMIKTKRKDSNKFEFLPLRYKIL